MAHVGKILGAAEYASSQGVAGRHYKLANRMLWIVGELRAGAYVGDVNVRMSLFEVFRTSPRIPPSRTRTHTQGYRAGGCWESRFGSRSRVGGSKVKRIRGSEAFLLGEH